VSDDQHADLYWRKAIESLAGAESELANERFNNAVNRAYYAAFQAAVTKLLAGGVRTRNGRWAHTYVQSEFIGKLINRRHRFPTTACEMYQGEDPVGIYLIAIGDTDDLEEVIDLFIDRPVDLQVDEGLPLFVIPERTPERNAVIVAEQEAARRARFYF